MASRIEGLIHFIKDAFSNDKVLKLTTCIGQGTKSPTCFEKYFWHIGEGRVRMVICQDGVPVIEHCIGVTEIFHYVDRCPAFSVVPRGEFVEFLKRCKEYFPDF